MFAMPYKTTTWSKKKLLPMKICLKDMAIGTMILIEKYSRSHIESFFYIPKRNKRFLFRRIAFLNIIN